MEPLPNNATLIVSRDADVIGNELRLVRSGKDILLQRFARYRDGRYSPGRTILRLTPEEARALRDALDSMEL